MNRLAFAAIAVLATHLATHAVLGQQTASRPAFEVASVKPTSAVDQRDSVGARSTGISAGTAAGDPGYVVYSHTSLKRLLIRAYDLRPFDLHGPAWLDTEEYDITAKVPKGAPKDQIPVMLQNLLVERFQIKFHWDAKESPIYALLAGTAGLKLVKARPKEGAFIMESDPSTKRTNGFTSFGHLTWRGSTFDDLALSLSNFLGRNVFNETGLSGTYDIALDAAPDSLPGLRLGQAPPPEASVSSPSIESAIRALGLTLEPRRGAVKQLVIDSAERTPTAN